MKKEFKKFAWLWTLKIGRLYITIGLRRKEWRGKGRGKAKTGVEQQVMLMSR